MNMNYCVECGAPLTLRPHPTEPPTPYCDRCGEYRFPTFSTAVSVILLDAQGRRMLLIRQYGEPDPVLPAGYVDKGETAEEALVREIREELGMDAEEPRFLGSHWYAPSETLMLNFLARTRQTEARPNGEVDAWGWVPVTEAAARVAPGGLAEELLRDYPPAGGGADRQPV